MRRKGKPMRCCIMLTVQTVFPSPGSITADAAAIGR
jgi:hypothetical protein